MKKDVNVAVIGGGASGIMAAIAAADNGAKVTLFEKNDRVGKKILSTGNGKCNLGNLDFNMDKYFCSDKQKLHNIFEIFSLWDTITFFESNGMMVKNKDGYLYPYAEQASAVLDILRMRLMAMQIQTVLETEISSVEYNNSVEEFEITDTAGKKRKFHKVIVACGSPASLKAGEGMSGYQIAEALGHRVQRLVPGLVQLKSDESFIKALAGVRCQAKVSMYGEGLILQEETGELQFTDYGISGIPVFQLSRAAAYALDKGMDVTVHINFFPDFEENAFMYNARARYDMQKQKNLEEFLTGMVNKKINMVVIKRAGYKPGDSASLGWAAVSKLLKNYLDFPMHISSSNSLEHAQICAGGVDFEEITQELESKKIKGLFFSGEVIDVDGKCGGYNLQWAWTSGYIAGRNAAGNSTKNMLKTDFVEENTKC